jgi:hypothetical protein
MVSLDCIDGVQDKDKRRAHVKVEINIRVHKMQWIWAAKELLASQGLCSMEDHAVTL